MWNRQLKAARSTSEGWYGSGQGGLKRRGAAETPEIPLHNVTGMGSKTFFYQIHVPSVRCNSKMNGGKHVESQGGTKKGQEVGSSSWTAVPQETKQGLIHPRKRRSNLYFKHLARP